MINISSFLQKRSPNFLKGGERTQVRSGFARCCIVASYDWCRFPIIDLKKRRTFTLCTTYVLILPEKNC